MGNRPIFEWRLQNLVGILQLINSDEKESKKILVDEISKIIKSETETETKRNLMDTINRFLSGKLPIGDEWARRIELAVRELIKRNIFQSSYYLKPYILDFPPEKPIIAYILASVSIHNWHAIYLALKNIQEVKEASLVIGSSDIDAIIKIEANSLEVFNDLLIKEITAHPYIHKTQTLQALTYSQWQKQQPDREAKLDRLPFIIKQNPTNKQIADEDQSIISFPSLKIKDIFTQELNSKLDAVSSIKHGVVTIKRQSTLIRFPETILDATISKIRAIVVCNEIGKGENQRTQRYLKAQEEKDSYGKNKITIFRVFVLSGSPHQLFKNNQELCARIGFELRLSIIKVRYLEYDRWPNRHAGENRPRDFGIMDERVQWELLNVQNQEGMRHIKLSLDQNDINTDLSCFDEVWNEAREFDEDLKNKFIDINEKFESKNHETYKYNQIT